MPWDELTDKGWMIVGMNHYKLKGTRFLFCAMAKDGRCIVAEGVDETKVFAALKWKARVIAADSNRKDIDRLECCKA